MSSTLFYHLIRYIEWKAYEAYENVQVNVPHLSFTCLTIVQVTQVEDLQVQSGNFQIL